jgi:tRNA pseudouridine55 synthase
LQYRRPKKNIDGILLLDKPLGFSSNQVLQKVKHLFQATKAGHTGTLDPLATGLLPICLGEATKFAQYVTDADKTYIATVKFGATTTTGDAEGKVLSQSPVLFDLKTLEKVCKTFVGDITQIPPMYSALKFEGKALYEYARAGVEIERKARQVTITKISVENFANEIATITVSCSKGTYIRTLAEDIGNTLGCGAHLIGLRRTETAGFQLTQAITLENLIEQNAQNIPLESLLHPVDTAIANFPAVQLDKVAAMQLSQGQTVEALGKIPFGEIRAYDEENKFLGLCQSESGKISPKRLMRAVQN